MFTGLLNGLILCLEPHTIGYLLLGTAFGIVIGIIPGLGGVIGMSILLPFIYGMPPVMALALLLSIYASVSQGGSISAILVNIPGTAASAATLMDGYPMYKQGEGARALGAALGASGLGAVVGVLCLMVAIPLAQPIIMNFSNPEITMLVLIGITYVGALSGNQVRRGLIAGGLGLITSLIGYAPVSGTARFTLGIPDLYDGLHIVALATGLFGGGEMLALMGAKATESTGGKDALNVTINKAGLLTGFGDAFRHWSLILRCGGIGTFIGAIPGLGGEVAAFLAYAHGQQTSKNPELFGKGCVEGVIAPESANNAKEGGSLIPTLAFGVPGSAGMAVLLSAFLILGLNPGKEMLTTHLNITFSMAWLLAISNIVAIIMLLPFLGGLTRLAYSISARPSLLVPVILLLVVTASAVIRLYFMDIIICLIFTLIGYAAVRAGYSRSTILLGFVLGKIFEVNFFLSTQMYGPWFLLHRPIALLLLCIAIMGLVFQWVKSRKSAKWETISDSSDRRWADWALAAMFILTIAVSCTYPFEARLIPLAIGIPSLALVVWERMASRRMPERASERWNVVHLLWLVLLGGMVYFIGLVITIPIYTFLYLKFKGTERWQYSILTGIIVGGVFYTIFVLALQAQLYKGLIWM